MPNLESSRSIAATRGKRLEYITLGWNLIEGVAAVATGFSAGSISLMGFGIDSFIEVVSGAALLRRLSRDDEEQARERHEWTALRLVGACFVALALYLGIASTRNLVLHDSPEHTILGMVIAVISLVVMPILARAKRRVSVELDSAAMNADAQQTDFCAYLSAILLFGLVLNWLLGWWWADPLAALVMMPIIAREGYRALKAKACSC